MNLHTLRWCTLIKLVALVISLVSISWAGSNERVLYSFTGGADGGDPATPLTRDNQGNLYGTTVLGGAFNCGTVFELTPTGQGQWQESVLHSFNCFDEGKYPYGGVTLDAQGNLYGTTGSGGQGFCDGDGCGVVFELSQSGGPWTDTVLYSFQDSPDGWGAGVAPVFDRAGNLYGTTPDGGANGEGTIYELSQTNGQWTERVIYNFIGEDDGAIGGLGGLLVDGFGNLYGVTEIDGTNGAGTVFKMTPGPGGTWNFTALYEFQGQPDAGSPYGGLIADAHGILYGTTYYGGANGAGSVYKVGPGPTFGPWRDAVLYSFQGGTDGGMPLSTLVFDAAGNLYGTTSAGGDPECGCGVAFRLTPNDRGGWDESVLHTFGSSGDATYPTYGLTPDGAGNYLGTGVLGGSANMGAVYELTPLTVARR